jgi:hypothetical protein
MTSIDSSTLTHNGSSSPRSNIRLNTHPPYCCFIFSKRTVSTEIAYSSEIQKTKQISSTIYSLALVSSPLCYSRQEIKNYKAEFPRMAYHSNQISHPPIGFRYWMRDVWGGVKLGAYRH